jgi:anhydro-N-acetylmuramic acid kinase
VYILATIVCRFGVHAMNRNVSALVQIAAKSERKIIGLMSGTSLDGLDVALCALSGNGTQTLVRVEHFVTVDYEPSVKAEIRKVFAKQTIDFQHLALLNEWIGNLHAEMILDCLGKWGVCAGDVDLIASHGQTVMHAPTSIHRQTNFPNATLQIGDSDHIAVKTGIVTISDFRQKHLAAGGEGAPLAVYGDYFIFGQRGENRIMLNLGGIANFTFLPSDLDPRRVFVTDTGTCNTLVDALTQQHFPDESFDRDAQIASRGRFNRSLLDALKAHAFFAQAFPKTTGPELFNLDYVAAAQMRSGTLALPICDLLATLTRFSAETIAIAIRAATDHCEVSIKTFKVYLSGGGMHNPLLVHLLKELLPCEFLRTDVLGVRGDAKEAVLFAVLANECVVGGNADFGARCGIPSVTLGKVSFPW